MNQNIDPLPYSDSTKTPEFGPVYSIFARAQLPKLRPYAQKYGLNDEQLIKLMHYRGVGDAIKRLKTGDFSVSAEEKAKYNNPDIMEYLKGSIPK